MESIGKRIEQLRKQANLSQDELGATLNTARQTISKWEKGEQLPRADHIQKMCRLFNVSADFLLGSETLPEQTATEEIAAQQLSTETIQANTAQDAPPRNRRYTLRIVILSILGALLLAIDGFFIFVYSHNTFRADQTIAIKVWNIDPLFCAIISVAALFVAVGISLVLVIYKLFRKKKRKKTNEKDSI